MSRPESLLRSFRFWILAAVIVGLAIVHQSNAIADPYLAQALDLAPYLPIILGALWYGLAGGALCAILTSSCFLSHLAIHGGGHLFATHNLPKVLNIGMYNVVGLVTGYLAGRQISLLERYRTAAEELRRSYAQLREKTEALIESEKQLSRANRLSALGELTAGLAHEIGNPLGAIKGAAEILAEGVDPADPRRRFADLCLTEVDRLDAVVRSFLGYARKEAAGDSIEATADLRKVLTEIAGLVEPQCERAGLALEVDVRSAGDTVACDPDRLRQVFLNLVLNAIQATPPGGRIRIVAARSNDRVECRVEDSGRGMPPEVLERIFEPFFTTRREGTGLGLAIAHRIVLSQGGAIGVESEPGKGTTFRVQLPLTEAARGVQVGADRR